MTTNVELAVADQVARVTFVGDKGIQLFSAATLAQLAEVVTEVEQNAEASVVVFEAAGRTYIAGADIKELSELNPETAETMSLEAQQIMTRISRLPATTLAAIHAACAGGGCELALACDMRMAADNAKIGLPETSLGVIPGWGGTVRAARLLGTAAARRMILTGELLVADEALRLGLVDSVSPADTFREAVEARVAQILLRGPHARRLAKHLLHTFEGPDIDEQLRAEARAFAACYKTDEPAEGTAAFLEKRVPNWSAK